MRNSERYLKQNDYGGQGYRYKSESYEVGERGRVKKGAYRNEEDSMQNQIETCEDIIRNLKVLKEKQRYAQRQRASNP